MLRFQVLKDYNGRDIDDPLLVLSILSSPYVSNVDTLNYWDSSTFTVHLIDGTSICFDYVHI